MKRRKAHRIPLTPQAIEILDQIRPQSEQYGYVFPSERDTNSHVSLFTANAAIKRSLSDCAQSLLPSFMNKVLIVYLLKHVYLMQIKMK